LGAVVALTVEYRRPCRLGATACGLYQDTVLPHLRPMAGNLPCRGGPLSVKAAAVVTGGRKQQIRVLAPPGAMLVLQNSSLAEELQIAVREPCLGPTVPRAGLPHRERTNTCTMPPPQIRLFLLPMVRHFHVP
jgi:hypothetical protein